MWFIIALINPVFHATINHLDKYLLSDYLKKHLGEEYNPTGALILISALFSIVILPIILLFNPGVLSISIVQGIVLMVNGALLVTAIICYFYALERDEASIVAPLFQLIPVFSIFLGYFFLGEVLSTNKLIAIIFVVFGGIILSLDLNNGVKKANIMKRLIGLMIISSLCYSLNAIVFKLIATQQGFLDSLFWDMAGKLTFGIILFFFVRSYRESFMAIINLRKTKVYAINAGNEVLAIVGEIAIVLAVLYAPVAMVQSVGGLQPLFVLLIGLLIPVLFKKIAKKSLTRNEIVQQVIGVVIITLGGILLTV